MRRRPAAGRSPGARRPGSPVGTAPLPASPRPTAASADGRRRLDLAVPASGAGAGAAATAGSSAGASVVADRGGDETGRCGHRGRSDGRRRLGLRAALAGRGPRRRERAGPDSPGGDGPERRIRRRRRARRHVRARHRGRCGLAGRAQTGGLGGGLLGDRVEQRHRRRRRHPRATRHPERAHRPYGPSGGPRPRRRRAACRTPGTRGARRAPPHRIRGRRSHVRSSLTSTAAPRAGRTYSVPDVKRGFQSPFGSDPMAPDGARERRASTVHAACRQAQATPARTRPPIQSATNATTETTITSGSPVDRPTWTGVPRRRCGQDGRDDREQQPDRRDREHDDRPDGMPDGARDRPAEPATGGAPVEHDPARREPTEDLAEQPRRRAASSTVSGTDRSTRQAMGVTASPGSVSSRYVAATMVAVPNASAAPNGSIARRRAPRMRAATPAVPDAVRQRRSRSSRPRRWRRSG